MKAAAGCPGHRVASSGPLPLRDEHLWVAGRLMTTKIKWEPSWTTNPLGFPEE